MNSNDTTVVECCDCSTPFPVFVRQTLLGRGMQCRTCEREIGLKQREASLKQGMTLVRTMLDEANYTITHLRNELREAKL